MSELFPEGLKVKDPHAKNALYVDEAAFATGVQWPAFVTKDPDLFFHAKRNVHFQSTLMSLKVSGKKAAEVLTKLKREAGEIGADEIVKFVSRESTSDGNSIAIALRVVKADGKVGKKPAKKAAKKAAPPSPPPAPPAMPADATISE
jgi:hypothetical protein